ncbi:MAG: Fic family protein, partial [Thermoguttaceae bacterium]|nr:Fic family protein [Thermoguttaceae bacterium]
MPVKKPNDKFPFKTLTPRFDSDLTRLILKLEPYRNENFRNGATPNVWFEGLKPIFFILESVASARIEGNRTTVAEYVASVENETPEDASPERIREIGNLVAGLKFIEEQLGDGAASQMAIRELHKIAVNNLSVANEGDRTPGDYRKTNVRIANSKHTPPDAGDVPSYVARLVDWLNEPSDDLYDLIKIAQSHWAFVWIHPFGNGNGRAARLFTYALLRKYGFVPDGLIVNPNGLFCAEREKYYRF